MSSNIDNQLNRPGSASHAAFTQAYEALKQRYEKLQGDYQQERKHRKRLEASYHGKTNESPGVARSLSNNGSLVMEGIVSDQHSSSRTRGEERVKFLELELANCKSEKDSLTRKLQEVYDKYKILASKHNMLINENKKLKEDITVLSSQQVPAQNTESQEINRLKKELKKYENYAMEYQNQMQRLKDQIEHQSMAVQPTQQSMQLESIKRFESLNHIKIRFEKFRDENEKLKRKIFNLEGSIHVVCNAFKDLKSSKLHTDEDYNDYILGDRVPQRNTRDVNGAHNSEEPSNSIDKDSWKDTLCDGLIRSDSESTLKDEELTFTYKNDYSAKRPSPNDDRQVTIQPSRNRRLQGSDEEEQMRFDMFAGSVEGMSSSLFLGGASESTEETIDLNSKKIQVCYVCDLPQEMTQRSFERHVKQCFEDYTRSNERKKENKSPDSQSSSTTSTHSVRRCPLCQRDFVGDESSESQKEFEVHVHSHFNENLESTTSSNTNDSFEVIDNCKI